MITSRKNKLCLNYSVFNKDFYIEPVLNKSHGLLSFEVDKSSYSTNAPYLLTTGLSDCIGIIFFYKDANEAVKLGLFHSFSEHGDQPTNDFKNFIFGFLKTIENTPSIEIRLGFNEVNHSESSQKSSIQHIFENVSECCKALKKPSIPIENFQAIKVDTSLYIAEDGRCGSFYLGIDEALQNIKKMILALPTNQSTFIGKIAYKFSSQHFLISPGIKKILALLDQENNLRPYSQNKILLEIKDIAGKSLLNHSQTEEKEICYLKIIAWDIILNKPTKELLNEWLEAARYKAKSHVIKAAIETVPASTVIQLAL